MIRLALAAALGLTAWPAASDLCDGAAPGLIYASCRGEARVELLLAPEDLSDTPARALDVTGGYTARDRRKGGLPKPVGLFVRGGEVVSREYVRFDGVLLVERGRPSLHYRRAVTLAGQLYNLEQPADRRAFLAAAAEAGAGVLQSHLLIINGEVDTRPVADAPEFRRRILFQTADGAFGVHDTGARLLTLDEAAREVAAAYAPAMAINLDMGSYDFCSAGGMLCGALGAQGRAKLSNLLRFY